MTRLAEIKSAISGPKQNPKSIHVNPLQVISVEAVPGGTRINLPDGKSIETKVEMTEVIGVLQNAMG